jgi:hypothetical protein
MSFILKVPTHLDGRNPIVGRYTARELVPVVAGAFGAAGVLGQPHLPAPVRIAEAVTVVALGGAAGLVRPGGRLLVTWGRLATAQALAERTSAWKPPAASAPAPRDVGALRPPHLALAPVAGSPAPTLPPSVSPASPRRTPRPARPATHRHPFVPAEIAEDTITFADGHRCAVLECSGANVEGMDTEGQRALHAAYHAFLLGLSFPVQVLVCADPVDLGPYAARRMARLAGQPLATRRLGSADAAYMRRALARAGALDQRVYVVIPAMATLASSVPDGAGLLALLRSRRRPTADGRARDRAGGRGPDEAGRVLTERCAAVREALTQAGVHAWHLDTPALRALCYRRLCPRTARLQPFDAGHADPVATAPVFFAQATDDTTQDGEGDEEGDDDDDDA